MNIQFNKKNKILNFDNLPENGVYPLMEHGNKVLVVNSLKEAKNIPHRTQVADAVITTSQDVLLILPTADCAPIALIDEQAGILAMMHCGWKPTLRGIIENTLKKMQELGSKPQNIKAIIGPCIDEKSFECKNDMRKQFLEKDNDFKIFFRNKSTEKYTFDLKQFCQVKLYSLGIGTVKIANVDTFANSNYHSYRQYCHKYGKGFNIAQHKGAFMNFNQASLNYSKTT